MATNSGARVIVKLRSTESPHIYTTTKSRRRGWRSKIRPLREKARRLPRYAVSMSSKCLIIGKGPGFGDSVSHSNRKTRRVRRIAPLGRGATPKDIA